MSFFYSDRDNNEFPHSFTIIGIMGGDAWQHALSYMDLEKSHLGRLGEKTWVVLKQEICDDLEMAFGAIGERWLFEGHGSLISVSFRFKYKKDAMRFRLMYDNI